MNILVCGGAGYIGSQTAKTLAEAGHTPVVYDSLEKGHRWAVRWGPLVEGDLADRQRLAEAFSAYAIDAVIDFAAYLAVGESMSHPEKYFRNNVANTLNLLGAMNDAGVKRIVFSSTAAVYGMPQVCPIPEDHPLAPVNVYGETKLMVETMLDWFSSCHGFVSAKLRYFNAAGADPEGEIGEDHDPETHLIPLVIAAALGKIPSVDLYGTDYPTPDGTAIRDYIHVADLALAHLKALEYIVQSGRNLTANLGTGKGDSVREVIRTAEKLSCKPIPVLEKPRRAGDPPELVADSSRARKLLDWQPRYNLDDILTHAWRWHRRSDPL